ncbi:MAG: 2,3-bisphosphoglycerate-independent phosphoglycerate mutase [Alphaproteobacteria bacterium]
MNGRSFESSRKRPRPAVLCVLDGWGWREETRDNAIASARTPSYTRMLRECPHALLASSGRAVGLPAGQMGNSEVGHMNIGAGRVVMQDLPRIDDAIERGELGKQPALAELIRKAGKAGGAVHLMGLLSPGGVHSHQNHIAALARVLNEAGLAVHLHTFLDGRDTPPKSALGYVGKFLSDVAEASRVSIATVGGRYYAMDRDKRWERCEKAYEALVDAKGAKFPNAKAAIESAYAQGVTDEFVAPCAIEGYSGMRDGDAMIFANFRADRARQLSLALNDPGFANFTRARTPRFSASASMTEYSAELNRLMSVIFPPEDIKESLGEIVSELGLKQLRIAETEKYAHVTFFLNCGRETPFEGEDRILVPSPKIATYDLKPSMSAHEVTDKLVEAVGSGKYDLIVVNYANPDMVGHTGVMKAAVEAVEVTDHCLGSLREAVEKAGGILLITADHGNVEFMRDETTGQPHTAHTTLDVPLIVVNAKAAAVPVTKLASGKLADVAPTLLALMGIEKPPQMAGHSLVEPLPALAESR